MTPVSSDAAVTFATKKNEMLVGGERVPVTRGERLDVVDPATGGMVASVPAESTQDVDHAANAAARRCRHGKR